MSRFIRVGVFAAAIVGLASAQAADARQAASQVRAGRELAQTVCSACHQVESNQEFPPVLDPPAPSFQVIADRPNTTLASLKTFMANTKWDEHTLPMKMPNMMLEPGQQTQLARYIMSLRKAPPR